MKLLLHICCAPCLIYPLKILKQDQHELTGCFYNPNIHPSREYQRRADTLRDYAERQALHVIWPDDYDMEAFVRRVAAGAADRCDVCYEMRLRYTADLARRLACDGFTTTLLYSKYQKHDRIRATAERLAQEYGIPFYYRDFREGWSEGVRISKEAGMYRQPYCGCIYSEKERYWRCSADGCNRRKVPVCVDYDTPDRRRWESGCGSSGQDRHIINEVKHLKSHIIYDVIQV